MEWVDTAEEYIAQHGWGARGRNNSASRLLHDGERQSIARGKWVAGLRPRGVLSGFLAIVPRAGYATFLPPLTVKLAPQRIRLRISDELVEQGAVFSAYMTRERRLVVEDVLVWKGDPVWYTVPFHKRWNEIIHVFGTQEWRADLDYQGLSIELATYTPLSAAKEPDASSVVEFVPNLPNQRRLIWIPGRDATGTGGATTSPVPARSAGAAPTPQQTIAVKPVAPSAPIVLATSSPRQAPTPTPTPTAAAGLVAKKEALMGPDVYSVWRGGEKLGLALVRTLAISRALRVCTAETIRIEATWNKQFDKWEVVEILPN